MVVHGYETVNQARLWNTVVNDVPDLEKALLDVLREHGFDVQ